MISMLKIDKLKYFHNDDQKLNDSPQPHVDFSFGLLNTNREDNLSVL